ncbi:MAG: putative rane protein [Roseomonas sp.]|jgi:drug/metabolite transporter (DMT)-like permease|nr:putative rane protein [Roseomonas sp.]
MEIAGGGLTPAAARCMMARMSATLTGIALNLVALVLFVTMDTTGKLLTVHYPVPQLVFVRFVFHVVFVALAIRVLTGSLPWRSRAPVLQAVRGFCLMAASLLFVGAIALIPLADATAVGFASPLLTVLLAALWLKERVEWRRWLGVGVGLAGVLVALRPPFLTGGPAPHWAILLPLCNAMLYAVYQILTRKLASIDDPRTTILHTGVVGAVLLALVQPFVWQWPGSSGPVSAGWIWTGMIALGALGAAGHGLLVLAFSRVQASLLAPVMYTQLVWALIASALVFNHWPDRFTLTGAAIIACGGVLVALPRRRPKGGER